MLCPVTTVRYTDMKCDTNRPAVVADTRAVSQSSLQAAYTRCRTYGGRIQLRDGQQRAQTGAVDNNVIGRYARSDQRTVHRQCY
jgi:hypothetical protein